MVRVASRIGIFYFSRFGEFLFRCPVAQAASLCFLDYYWLAALAACATCLFWYADRLIGRPGDAAERTRGRGLAIPWLTTWLT